MRQAEGGRGHLGYIQSLEGWRPPVHTGLILPGLHFARESQNIDCGVNDAGFKCRD